MRFSRFFQTQAQPTLATGVFLGVRPFPTDSKTFSPSLQSAPNSPAANTPPEATEEFKAADSGQDETLDALLGRVLPPVISVGFADRVIHGVAPTDAGATKAAPSKWMRTVWMAAAALALCGGLVWWDHSPAGPRPLALTNLPAAPTEEEVLLKALTTLEINSGDLALVAQLGEVLEAELAEKTSWLETD